MRTYRRLPAYLQPARGSIVRGAVTTSLALVANAVPNVSTELLTLNSFLTTNPLLYRKLGFGIERDLQRLTRLSSVLDLLERHPAAPASSVKERIALPKSKPGTLASAGIGSPEWDCRRPKRSLTGDLAVPR